MTDTARLSNKISGTLEKHHADISERQKILDGTMKELLEQRELFASTARHIIESVIHPRIRELTRHFDNASIMECHGDTDFHCVCKFNHVPRYPATVSLDFSVMPEDDPSRVAVHYGLEILPVLMEYKRNDEMRAAARSEVEIGLWIEERIVDFVETYLRLETHPLYQKDNLVTDPVCGMRVSSIAATSKVEWPGHTIYFCSEVCKDTFLKEHY